MALIDLTEIFRFLDENDVTPVLPIPNDLKCKICKKLLNNACVSPCGCRFCRRCMEQYGSTGDQCCPGDGDKCQTVIITAPEQDASDNRTNMKVSTIIVKCPKTFCLVEDDLYTIVQHVRVCPVKSNKSCPYNPFGCEAISSSSMEADSHLKTETEKHIKLIAECVDNIKTKFETGIINEFYSKIESFGKHISDMETKQVGLVDENVSTKVTLQQLHKRLEDIHELFTKQVRESQQIQQNLEIQITKRESKIVGLANVMKDMRNEISSMKNEMKSLKRENSHLALQVKEIQANASLDGCETPKSPGCFQDLKTVQAQLLQKSRSLEREITDMKAELLCLHDCLKEKTVDSQFEAVKKEIDCSNFKRAELREQIETIRKALAFRDGVLEIVKEKLSNKIKDLETHQEYVISRIAIHRIGDFLWKVDKLSQRREHAQRGFCRFVDSDSFYSSKNGYCLRLRMHPDGVGSSTRNFMSVGFVLMKGDYDELLQWPCTTLAMTISIIEAETGADVLSTTFSFDKTADFWKKCYSQPKSKSNPACNCDEFAPWDVLADDIRIIRNDTIYLKCSFTPS